MAKNGNTILNLNKLAINGSNSKDRIVYSHKDIKDFVVHCKGLGLKVVLVQGTWDMVHIGHARYLEEAKRAGDILIVGVDSDKKVRHRKGPDRPVVPQDERLEMLTHLRPVDLVVLKELNDPKWALIKTVQPDVLIAIQENYTREQVRKLKEHCKVVKILPRQATTSTSAKLRLLQINVAQKLGKAITPKLVHTIESALEDLKNGK